MGLLSISRGETVIVVIDGSPGKGSLDALEWAIKYIVGPNDTIVVLGVLPEIVKKYNPSCLPFHLGIGTSGIYIKLEFSSSATGEMTPSELEKEIGKKKREYQRFLEPYYNHCKKREVKLDIRLTAGLESKKVVVDAAQQLDPQWIVLDGYFKKDKEYIQMHVNCHVALLKTKGIATLIPSKITGPESEEWQSVCRKIDDQPFTTDDFVESETPLTPCSHPLSWRTGFPRAFSLGEIDEITNGFNNICLKDERKIIYRGVFGEFPVIVMCLPADDQTLALLKIASRVRHRNISSLIGYCCVGDSVFFLYDRPKGSLETCLLCDKAAMNLSWNSRWGVAIEIGEGMRYLHEEFVDGSIVNLSMSSYNVSLSGGSSAMLSIYKTTTKQVKLQDDHLSQLLSEKGKNMDMDEQLRADVNDYGVLLLELLTGQSRRFFENEGRSLVEWALPLLEKNLLSPLLDQRLPETNDPQVTHMARAALSCLKNESNDNLTISKVLAVVRGDQ